MKQNIQILDCTLRDGGFGFEDAYKSGTGDYTFTPAQAEAITQELVSANFDIIELGSIERTEEDKSRFAVFKTLEDVSARIPADRKPGQLFAALYRGPDTPLDDIPDWSPKYCDVIRVILRYTDLKGSLDFCAALCAKGYKVCLQPMLTMRYSDAELAMVCDAANAMNAFSMYFVDSFGYMTPADITRLYDLCHARLDSHIKMGFHAHNNINMAYANALALIAHGTTRDLILDACILGLGQGAGNLQAELIACHLNESNESQYHLPAIWAACDLIETYQIPSFCGYSIVNFIPAVYKTSYKYSNALRHEYGCSYAQIAHILSQVPPELKFQFVPENTEKLINHVGLKLKKIK